ncbi:MAG: haloacid dehalogenase-like hydrolase [Oscillibacter sp.]|nr:haloacid dehalogenase-like hydrolase [Oscillibacter sp.]
MSNQPILALMYDFDHTLSPRDMQEYAFIPSLGMESGAFWDACGEAMRSHNMDQILAYMYVMLEKAAGKQLVTHDTLRELGRGVQLFPGVKTWFRRVNAYAEKQGLVPEHYIISSGLKEIIEGTAIAGEFREIYAAAFCYDGRGVPVWPAMAVNYTSKTQFLFRINKGVLDVGENRGLNEYMPEDRRRVPFRNMIYIGDGLTDVPCMKLTKVNGGHSIAVYQEDRREADDMIRHGRIDCVVRADYSRGSELEQTVFEIIDQVAATARTMRRCMEHSDRARRELEEQRKS